MAASRASMALTQGRIVMIAQMIPEMPAGGSSTSLPASLVERVTASKMRARRRWAVRTGMLLLVSGILLATLVIWQRDSETRSAWLRTTSRSAAAIQAHFDQTGYLPANLPYASEFVPMTYASYADRFYAVNASRPVIIAMSGSLPLVLQPDGRTVIIFENGTVRTEWMSTGAFTTAYLEQLRDAEQFEHERRSRVPQLP